MHVSGFVSRTTCSPFAYASALAPSPTFVRAHSERCFRFCCSADTCRKCFTPMSLQMRARRSGK